MISYGRQEIDESDVQAVLAVLRSDFLTQGPALERFERKVADYCGAKYAVAVTSATAGLHIACKAAGLAPDGSLWTTPITFVASANCGRYCGAAVDFVDIDDVSYNMSVGALREKLASGMKKPDVLVPVHLCGQSCDMAAIHALAQQYGFSIIEDAAHALGATYKDSRVGSCQFSDMTVFSFHPVKIITTGEGGMVLTNRRDLYDKLRLYRSHGITREPGQMTREPDGAWYYQQLGIGFNYRMTDIQAALGCSQMERLDMFLARRRYLAKRYDELLQGLPLRIPRQAADTNSSWHIYVVRIDFSRVKKSKQQIFTAMRDEGVLLNVHYIPVHTQPYYARLGHRPEDCPTALRYYEEAFTLPLYVQLTDAQQERVVNALRKVLS